MPNDAERMRALTAATNALEKTEKGLKQAVDDLQESVEEQNTHNSRKIGWSIGAAAFAVVLSALVLVGYFKLVTLFEQQAQTSARLEVIIEQQDVIRRDAVCLILSYLVGGYDPSSRAPGAARETAEENLAAQRHVYSDVLRCATPLVPPRGDLVTKPPK